MFLKAATPEFALRAFLSEKLSNTNLQIQKQMQIQIQMQIQTQMQIQIQRDVNQLFV